MGCELSGEGQVVQPGNAVGSRRWSWSNATSLRGQPRRKYRTVVTVAVARRTPRSSRAGRRRARWAPGKPQRSRRPAGRPGAGSAQCVRGEQEEHSRDEEDSRELGDPHRVADGGVEADAPQGHHQNAYGSAEVSAVRGDEELTGQDGPRTHADGAARHLAHHAGQAAAEDSGGDTGQQDKGHLDHTPSVTRGKIFSQCGIIAPWLRLSLSLSRCATT